MNKLNILEKFLEPCNAYGASLNMLRVITEYNSFYSPYFLKR